MAFELMAPFPPRGDQPRAIEELTEGLKRGDKYQTLLGVTGSGKTFTIANVIAQHAAADAGDGATTRRWRRSSTARSRSSFPKNAVEYFVSYYDYYQPEAYIPSTDTYIEKDSSINDEIEQLRAAATTLPAGARRRDHRGLGVLHLRHGRPARVPASSCWCSKQGQKIGREQILRRLVDIQYERNDVGLPPRHVPRARRHRGGVPRLRGAGRSASSSAATRSSASRVRSAPRRHHRW